MSPWMDGVTVLMDGWCDGWMAIAHSQHSETVEPALLVKHVVSDIQVHIIERT